MRYRITNHDNGYSRVYEGKSQRDALDAMARDHGCAHAEQLMCMFYGTGKSNLEIEPLPTWDEALEFAERGELSDGVAISALRREFKRRVEQEVDRPREEILVALTKAMNEALARGVMRTVVIRGTFKV